MKKFPPIFLVAIVWLLLVALPVSVGAKEPESGLELSISTLSLKLVLIGLGLTALFILMAILLSPKKETVKRVLFNLIIISVITPTLVLVFITVYLNLNSWSHGPVHWHADYEVWVCGEKLDLVAPTGWSNKIGTPTLHEHNDNRLHLEGVALTAHDVSFGRFFRVIGGEITPTSLIFPDKNGLVQRTTGAHCPDDTIGTLQAYAYRVNNDNTYTQRKVLSPELYIPTPQSIVPPGDCIIVEFGPTSPVTEKLCRSWQVALETGKLTNDIEPTPTPTPIVIPSPQETPIL